MKIARTLKLKSGFGSIPRETRISENDGEGGVFCEVAVGCAGTTTGLTEVSTTCVDAVTATVGVLDRGRGVAVGGNGVTVMVAV